MYEVLYQNSFLTLRALNIALALGFIFGGIFCIRYVERHKLSQSFLTKHFVQLILAGILGGRLLYVLEHLAFFEQNPFFALYLWDLNFSFFGILLGLIPTLYYFARRSREDFWAWLDAMFLTTLAVLTFVHLGFFFSGHDYGLPTGLPWGVVMLAYHIPFTIPIHPTQIYAMLLTLGLLTYGVKKSKRIHLSGVIGTRVMAIYAVGMLGIDFLHGLPSWYTKIGYGILAALAFIATVHCGHKTHINE